MRPYVSVIVPVYNMENYLEKSVSSVLAQSLKNIEVILVNDGSIDRSLEICKTFEINDSRIKVIDKVNGGVSSARNAGLKAATGEYIGFMDPDDWIEPDMFENLYKKITETNSDVAMCNYVRKTPNGNQPVMIDTPKETLEKEDIYNVLIRKMISRKDINDLKDTLWGTVWRTLIKKELIDKNNVEFNIEISFMEDLIFVINILLQANKVILLEPCYYHYLVRENSAVTVFKSNLKDSNLKVYYLIESLLKSNNKLTRFEEAMKLRYIFLHLDLIANIVGKKNKNSEISKKSYINDICKDKKLREYLSELNLQNSTFRKKVLLTSIKYNQPLITYLYQKLVVWTSQIK